MMKKMSRHLNKNFEATYSVTKDDFSEQFLLFLLASMLLVEKFDFMTILLSKAQINLDENPDSLNRLPVSDNFKANMWRFSAIF
jgi:hypothetical protein